MKTKTLFITILFLASASAFAQSPKTVLIEHFTNTRCSICASKNPAFYQTLTNYPQVLHIAFHPSAPYSQCFFSLQNRAENDARTNYYNAFGSTPKLALNGKLLAGATPLINNTTLDTAINQTSPVEVAAYEELIGADSVRVKVVVKTTAAVAVPNALLFAGVAENPINYNAANGETVHRDVFRKALTNATGNLFALPPLNDSSVFEFTYRVESNWTIGNIYTLAFLQRDDTKEILNAAKSVRIVSIPSGVGAINADEFSISPNPVHDIIAINTSSKNQLLPYCILDLTGRKIAEGKVADQQIDMRQLEKGIYFLRINDRAKKFIKL